MKKWIRESWKMKYLLGAGANVFRDRMPRGNSRVGENSVWNFLPRVCRPKPKIFAWSEPKYYNYNECQCRNVYLKILRIVCLL